MRLTRGGMFVGGALLVTWLVAAAQQHGGDPGAAPGAQDDQARAVSDAEQLAREIESQATRLRERLSAAPAISADGRNPFAFELRRSSRRAAAQVVAAPVDSFPSPPLPDPMPFTLSGIAEDGDPGAPVRTAVLSAFGDVFLVKAGETIVSRFEVVAVGADSVELKDLTTSRTIRLGLR